MSGLGIKNRLPRIGELRDRVVVLSLTSSADSQGGFTETWTSTLATIWANVTDVSGRERFRGLQQENRRLYEIVCRWRSDIDPRQRATWNGRTLRFIGIDYIDGRNRFLKITAEEVPAEGT